MGHAHWKLTSRLAALAAFAVGSSAAAETPRSCSVSGEARLDSNVAMYDEASGGDAIAKFTGAKIAVSVTAFPRTSNGRARVTTSGFSLEGYVPTRDLPVQTSRAVPVYSGHVWIGAHRQVRVVDAREDKLKIQKELSFPIQQTLETWTPCSSLTLTEIVPSGHQPDGHARGYVLKKSSLDLFSDAGGASGVLTVNRAPAASGVLFFSTERKGAWVHVEHYGEVVIDAWARARDLEALPRGETMDQVGPSSVTKHGSPRLRLQGDPRVVKAAKSVTIRGRASDDGPKIGRIERGTVVYVVDVIAGWASVMPKDLSVAPAGDAQFWVKSAELGE